MKRIILPGLLAALVVACEQSPEQQAQSQNLPPLHEIENVQQKKQTFTDFITPLIEASNSKILQQRSDVEAINAKLIAGSVLSNKQKQTLSELSELYRVEQSLDEKAQVQQLLVKVDLIPPALVLAQAANESAWGTSRFAREGNNLFGQWCYKKGCGLVPLNRNDGANHEVRKFDSVYESVSVYMNNLNSHPAYKGFQQQRNQARASGELNAIELATQLSSYSERGQAYVEELQQMMRVNQKLWPTRTPIIAG
ncbi:glucosaminidase domain-containing protein [Agarivorans aestuarii]|uniref:Glucosaminidase domain-containing protein n=1 Tax=Agarivorans aestuarii TaxID=1563703 RepID=A0ABU7G201_9ALTE|nr:glucosaminidase domain-containing protein [Agarivorans aestuarii]MEE1673295.1 glucosaminidase domain-containing protein [Agarivorans aestuarii]